MKESLRYLLSLEKRHWYVILQKRSENDFYGPKFSTHERKSKIKPAQRMWLDTVH